MRAYSSLLALVFCSLSIFSANSYASDTFNYKCECIDDGYECIGIDVMNLTVDSENVSYTFPNYNGNTYDAEFDSKYAPKKYEDYSRYNISNSKNYPYLLVETAMIEGASSGSVKLPQLNDDGKFVATWRFDCSLGK